MSYNAYTTFVEAFGELGPYQLDHFCRVLHEEYYAYLTQSKQKIVNPITPAGIMKIMIRAMRTATIAVAEQKIKEAEHELELTKHRLFVK